AYIRYFCPKVHCDRHWPGWAPHRRGPGARSRRRALGDDTDEVGESPVIVQIVSRHAARSPPVPRRISWSSCCRTRARRAADGARRRKRCLLDARENLLAALGQLVQIVDKIDQQEFRRELSRERRLHAKVELAATRREFAVTFVIIDDGLVIELGRA